MRAKKLLNMAQAGKLIGMTRAAVAHAIRRGLLKAEQHGPYSLVPEEEALRYKTHRPTAGRPKKNEEK